MLRVWRVGFRVTARREVSNQWFDPSSTMSPDCFEAPLRVAMHAPRGLWMSS